MAQVTFPPELGGDGKTYSDDSNPTTGMGNGGHRTRFVPALGQSLAMATTARNKAGEALTSAKNAATSETNAGQSANAAAGSASAANTSAQNAASSASAALIQANRAEAEADRAQQYVASHDQLTHRDWEDQHPIGAISGLQEELDGLDSSVSDLETSVSDLRSNLDASTISYNYTTDTYDLSKHRITATHKACRRCLLSDDGNVNYFLDQHDSNKKEDGTPADLTGGDGQVMVEIPRFWFGVNHIGETIQVTQSPIPLPGLIPHPVFTTGGDFDAVYVGAYNATVQQPDGTIIPGLNLDNNTARVSLEVDKLSSLSGGDNYAMVGLSLDEFRALANNRGEGWDEFSFLAWQALQVLGYTFLGSFNGQASLGNGNVSKAYVDPSSIQSDSPHTLNGASNILGNEAGATNDFMSLLGVENLWGQCWQWVDGVLFQDAQAYVSAIPASTITADYYPVGTPISQAGTSGTYFSEFQKLVNSILIPGAGPGDSSRFVGDGFWWDSGLRGALVGGRADDGARCGLACLDANLVPGGRARSVGGRVMFKRSRG